MLIIARGAGKSKIFRHFSAHSFLCISTAPRGKQKNKETLARLFIFSGYCLLFAKHSLQYTALPSVGLKGTFAS